MMTFMPFDNFEASAEYLDPKRLFKQVIEAKQMLQALGSTEIPEEWIIEPNKRIRHHPATKAWKGYDKALCAYYNAMLHEAKKRGFNVKMDYLIKSDGSMYLESDIVQGLYEYPWWMGCDNLHKSHRARLFDKNPDYYDDCDVKGYNKGQYWYPCSDGSFNFFRQSDKLMFDKSYLSVDDLVQGQRYKIEYDYSFKIACIVFDSVEDELMINFTRYGKSSIESAEIIDYNEGLFSDQDCKVFRIIAE